MPSSLSASERLDHFLRWAHHRSLVLHPALHILPCSPNDHCLLASAPTSPPHLNLHFSVHLRPFPSPTIIPPRSVLLSVPRSACFSKRTSSAARRSKLVPLSPQTQSENPALLLASHLALELSLGEGSPWWPYLCLFSLNSSHPLLPHLYLGKIPQLHKHLRGTRIAAWIKAQSRASSTSSDPGHGHHPYSLITLDHLRHYYSHSHLPRQKLFSNRLPEECSLEQFVKCYAWVSSRAFVIDNFVGLGLVPIADLFNHSDHPDLQLVSQTWVCQHCGCLDECALHEAEGMAQEDSVSYNDGSYPSEPLDQDTAVVELECQGALVPHPSHHRELYNTYGNLGNARLLVDYGFFIEANEQDRIDIDPCEILPLDHYKSLYPLFRRLVNGSHHFLETENEFFITYPQHPTSDRLEDHDQEEEEVGGTRSGCFIDCNAKMSLLLLFTLIAKGAQGSSSSHSLQSTILHFVNYLIQSSSTTDSDTTTSLTGATGESNCTREKTLEARLDSEAKSVAWKHSSWLPPVHQRVLSSIDRFFKLKLDQFEATDLMELGSEDVELPLHQDVVEQVEQVVAKYQLGERMIYETCAYKWRSLGD